MSDFKDLFISYGRKESIAFASKLFHKLKENGYDAWFDHVNIPKGDDFQLRIDNGIENAKNFVYIISPHANNSEFCLKEVELAIKLQKRIIPILHIDRELDKLHPVLGKINWIYSQEKEDANKPLTEWEAIDDFEAAFSDLIAIVNTEKEYVENHTQVLDRALEWEKGHHAVQHLLVGKERQEAEKWLLTQFKPPAQPPCIPSDLHCEYICASRKNGENLMTDAFICYDVKDKEIRDMVKRSLGRYAITTWTHDKDIEKGADYGKAIESGIEEADNFLFFISPESVQSKYCLIELEYAAKFNKRIIPLLITETPVEKFPPIVSKLQYIDFTDNVKEEDYFSDIEDILNEFKKDERYYEQHKVFLTQALKWEEQERNPSILLRGYNLQNAQAWLKIGKKRKIHKPTQLHEDFINESSSHAGEQNLEVFVSYSRTDGDFARKLNEQLQLSGKTTWFDQESIADGSDFQEEIYRGIETSDNFLFVISPDAINSEFCSDEVEYAAKLNKRFITLNYRDVEPSSMPAALSAVQWIDFKGDFHSSFSALLRTLDVDREHVQAHTKWQQRAMEWQNKDKGKDLLLRGNEFAVAKAWLDEAHEGKKKPIPTPLQEEYLEESNKGIAALLLKEKRTIARLRGLLVLAGIALIMAIFGGYFAYQKSQEAELAQIEAEKSYETAQKEAEESKRLFKLANKAKRTAKKETKKAKKALDDLAAKEEDLQIALAKAKRDENRAKVSAIKAELSAIQAEKAQKEAEVSQTLAEKEALANREAALALQLVKKDPTLAMRVIDKVYKTNKSAGIEQIVYDFYNEHNFYAQSFDVSKSSVYTLVASPSGEQFLTGGNDSEANLWDIKGNLIYNFKGHNNSVLAAVFTPNGKIISADWDKKIIIWTQDKIVKEFASGHSKPINELAISSNGKLLASADKSGAVKIWDIATAQEIKTFQLHSEQINAIQFSEDGTQLLTASDDNTAILTDIETGNNIQSFEHKKSVSSAVFSPDGSQILTSSWDRTTKLWNKNTGELIQNFDTDYTSDAIFTSNGESIIVASNNKTITVWNPKGKLLKTFRGHKNPVDNIAITPNGNSIISRAGKNVKIWHLSAQPIAEFTDVKSMHRVAFSPNNRSLLTQSKNKTEAILYSVAGYQLATLSGQHTRTIKSVAIAPSGDTLVTGASDATIKLWTKEGSFLKSIKAYGVENLSYSPKGNFIASVDYLHHLVIIDLENNTSSSRIEAHTKLVNTVVFSPKGDKILTVSADATAKIWDTRGTLLSTFKKYGKGLFSGCFSPNGKTILLAGKDKTAKLYDLDENLLQSFNGHTSYVISANFSPNGKMIITASTDRTVKVWALNGKLIKTFTDHNSIVNDALFSPNGKFIYSSDNSGKGILKHSIPSPQEFLESDNLASFKKEALMNEGIDVVDEFLKIEDVNERFQAGQDYFSLAQDTEELLLKRERFRSALRIYVNVSEDASASETLKKKTILYAGYCNEWLGWIDGKMDNPKNQILYQAKAIEFHTKYLEKENTTNNLTKLIGEIDKLAGYHFSIKEYQKAAVQLEQKIKLQKELLARTADKTKEKRNLAAYLTQLGAYYIYAQNFKKAEKVTTESLEHKSPNNIADMVLSRVYLLTNRYEKAKKIYLDLKDVKTEFAAYPTYKDLAIHHFDGMEKAGLPKKNINRMRKLLLPVPEQLAKGFISFDELLQFKDVEILSQTAAYYVDLAEDTGNSKIKVTHYYKAAQLYEKALENGADQTVKKEMASVYWNLSWEQLFVNQFKEAEKSVNRGIELGAKEGIYTNLPLAYLYSGQFEKAKKFYSEWKDKPYRSRTFRAAFLSDIADLESNNIKHKDASKIKELLTNSETKTITSAWKGLPYTTNIDAAVYYPNGKMYLFKDDEYVSWNIRTNVLNAQPAKISDYWPGVTFDKIDAGMYWEDNNRVYLFRGNKYVRYNVDLDKVDAGYPKTINNGTWEGVTFDHIDAAVTVGNKAFFFSDDEYIRYDIPSDKADKGYPKKISSLNWYGLEFNKVDAILRDGNGKTMFFSGDKVDDWGLEKE